MSGAGWTLGIVLGWDPGRVREPSELEKASRTIEPNNPTRGKLHILKGLCYSFFSTSRDGDSKHPWGAFFWYHKSLLWIMPHFQADNWI